MTGVERDAFLIVSAWAAIEAFDVRSVEHYGCEESSRDT
jgi:hypothetical protein